MDREPMTWVPLDTCAGIVEESIRETLNGRFFRGTVEEALHAARRWPGRAGETRSWRRSPQV